MLEKLITYEIVLVREDMTLNLAIGLMVKNGVSSILVHNENREITGMITERDVVRKFTLLDHDHKRTARVQTVMTRPVRFVQLQNLRREVLDLARKEGLRHFPVLNGQEPHLDNLVGMLTVTDFSRAFLHSYSDDRGMISVPPPDIVVIGHDVEKTRDLRKLVQEFGYECLPDNDPEILLEMAATDRLGVIFDLDEMGTIEGEHLIRLAKKHPGMLLLLTSSEKLVHPFEKHLNPMHQRIGLKPMDLRGFHWLLQGNRPSSESA